VRPGGNPVKGQKVEKGSQPGAPLVPDDKGIGLSFTELARHLEMTVPAVGYTVRGGETIALENHYNLVKSFS
jgi:hypothetical protein